MRRAAPVRDAARPWELGSFRFFSFWSSRRGFRFAGLGFGIFGAAFLFVTLQHGVFRGLDVEQGGIRVADRAHFEFGGDEAFDQGVLGLVEGLETAAELVEDLEEFVGIAVGREELAGGHAVHETVAAGDGFALRGAGSGTFLGVFAIGVGLRFGGHGMGPCVSLRVMAGVNLDRGFGNGAESEFQPADSIMKPAVCNSWAQRLQVIEKAGEIWV